MDAGVWFDAEHDEGGAVRRVVTRVIAPIVRFAEWVYGPTAAGIDLLLGALSAGWVGLMLLRPQIFDHGTFVGMNWLADDVWFFFFASLALLHLAGLLLLSWRTLRCAGALLSAWIWLSVAVSFATIEITTGVLVYGLIGSAALLGAIYLQGQPRKTVA